MLDVDTIRTDKKIWNEYALGMVFPRFLPEYAPDHEISQELRECARTMTLPWLLNESDLLWK